MYHVNMIKIDPYLTRYDAFLGATSAQIGVWLRLALYSEQKNDEGTIHDCRDWSDHKWIEACGLTTAEVLGENPLIYWKENDLHIYCVYQSTSGPTIFSGNQTL